ncbi:MAG: SDR family oxidoreductase, partial [Victivallaceae bacterium]|nr:SDR family oxidoreductase [Victivallaceae bacterium]
MEKVFLTGITGLVGSAVVVALSRERKGDYQFVCLARGNAVKSAETRVKEISEDEWRFEGIHDAAPTGLENGRGV